MSGTSSLATMTEGGARATAGAGEPDGPDRPDSPDGPRDGATQDIRLAIVMTGGASLAVWMGGVAREINLATAARSGHARGWSATDAVVAGRWAALLAALDVEISVDVLAGASAGGINVALLGYANAHDTDLGPLHDLWITLGSLRELMRRPDGRRFPSLLRGDEILLPALRRGLHSIAPRAGTARTIRPTSVFITTTILGGESSRWSDDLGGIIRDRDHRGLFVFGEDDLTDPEAAARLALAARASAAFPGAFEPAYVPVRNSPDADHPDMADYVNAAGDFYGSDGGILVNRPIGPAIQEVFERPARGRQVRRVLAYVVPAPNPPEDAPENPAGNPAADHGPGQRPGLPSATETLLGALDAALNQSISVDLRRIREHNEAVRGLRATRRALFRLAPAGGPRLTDQDIYEAYRGREAERAADAVVEVFDRIVVDAAAGPAPLDTVPADAAELLATAGGRMELRVAAVRAALAQFPDELPGQADTGELWRLGRPAVDAAKGILIAMINEGYVLATDPRDRRALAHLARGIHGAVVAPREQAGAHLLPLPSTPANRGAFTIVRHTLRDLAGAPSDAVVAEAARRWLRGVGDAETSQTDLTLAWTTLGSLTENLRDLLGRIVARSPARVLGRSPAAAASSRPAMPTAPTALLASAALLTQRPRTHPNGLSLAARRRVAARTLDDFVRYLPPRRGGAALALLDLHLVTRTLTGAEIVDQPVELVQVSADVRCDLDPGRATAARKLTGLQLGNFGAFAKSSWRANDWMWGRLDGAAWLVRILLDPRRLAWLRDTAGGRPSSTADEARWLTDFVDQLATIAAVPAPGPVLAELAWLDDPDAPVPAALPETAAWVAAGIQREIAAAELVSVATAVRADIDGAGASPAPNRTFLDAVAEHSEAGGDRVDPAATDAVLRTCRVADERLTDRANSAILVAAVAQTLAVLTAWLASLRALPRPLRPAVAAARTVTRLAHAAVDNLARRRYRVTITTGAVLFLAGLAGAVTQAGLLGGLGLLVTAVGLLMIGVTSWRTLTGGLTVAGVGGLAVLAAAGLIPAAGDRLFPWLRDDAVPYLADHPWAWAAVFTLLVLPPLWSLADLLRPRRRR
ncbi:patatin-like protein [Frankia sp. Cpl3]|nr:patatin-like protein [Parafrankia colletiae]MCK9898830.1 patatin-like protein [Frankia sp. Cpl3]